MKHHDRKKQHEANPKSISTKLYRAKSAHQHLEWRHLLPNIAMLVMCS